MKPNNIDLWSNARCIDIAFRNSFPSSVTDINNQKAIISKFVNFYLSGKVPKGETVDDIVFAVISIMPLNGPEQTEEKCIWHENHYTDNGTLFFSSPDQKLQYEINRIVKDKENPNENLDYIVESESTNDTTTNINDNSDTYFANDECKDPNVKSREDIDQKDDGSSKESVIQDDKEKQKEEKNQNENPSKTFNEYTKINWFRTKSSTTSNAQTSHQYGHIENSAFCKSCNKLLDNWNHVVSRLCLKYFFGIVALVLMRTRVKSFHNILNFFCSKFPALYHISGITYSPPHKSCIKKCWKSFLNLTPNAQTMYAKIVVNSFHIDKLNMSKQVRKNIFKMALLSHAANFGMGIINMLQEIHKSTEFYLVLEVLQTDETKEALSKVKSYIDMFLTNNEESTHHWSRMIEIEQFPYLCCKGNKLAVVLAAFLEKLKPNYTDIWKSSWVKAQRTEMSSKQIDTVIDLDSLKKLGYKMYEEYKKQESLNTSKMLVCLL